MLSARLTWGAVDVTASPLSFTVTPQDLVAVDVGLGRLEASSPEIFAAYVARSGTGGAVFQAQFVEERPDLAEIKRASVVRLFTTKGADEVLVPWALHSRLEDLVGWIVVRDGREVSAGLTTGMGVASATLPFAPAFLVRPALEARSHDLDVLAVGEGPALSLVRFRCADAFSPPVGSVLWTTPLPASITSVVSAVAAEPKTFPRTRHLALVSTTPDGVVVRHALLGTDPGASKPPASFVQELIEGRVPVPDAPPAILANDRGGARVSVFVSEAEDPTRCRLVELAFGPQPPSESPPRSVGVSLPVAPAAARIGYAHRAGGLRRDWAIRGVDGATYGPGPGGDWRRVRGPEPQSLPLVLVVLPQASYLLERAPDGAPMLHPVGL
jgi:hypothetical protein